MGFVDHLMLNPFTKQSHVCVCLRDCLRLLCYNEMPYAIVIALYALCYVIVKAEFI